MIYRLIYSFAKPAPEFLFPSCSASETDSMREPFARLNLYRVTAYDTRFSRADYLFEITQTIRSIDNVSDHGMLAYSITGEVSPVAQTNNAFLIKN